MRVAIAEACGVLDAPKCKPSIEQLEAILSSKDKLVVEVMPDGQVRSMPDYINDLNAMHEAEKVLQICTSGGSDCQWQRYWSALDEGPAGCVGRKQLLHATARQRAEAFLRTIGKWKLDESCPPPTP
jgi:hypothetical protein